MYIFLKNFSGVHAQACGVSSNGMKQEEVFLNPQSHIQTNSA